MNDTTNAQRICTWKECIQALNIDQKKEELKRLKQEILRLEPYAFFFPQWATRFGWTKECFTRLNSDASTQKKWWLSMDRESRRAFLVDECGVLEVFAKNACNIRRITNLPQPLQHCITQTRMPFRNIHLKSYNSIEQWEVRMSRASDAELSVEILRLGDLIQSIEPYTLIRPGALEDWTVEYFKPPTHYGLGTDSMTGYAKEIGAWYNGTGDGHVQMKTDDDRFFWLFRELSVLEPYAWLASTKNFEDLPRALRQMIMFKCSVYDMAHFA